MFTTAKEAIAESVNMASFTDLTIYGYTNASDYQSALDLGVLAYNAAFIDAVAAVQRDLAFSGKMPYTSFYAMIQDNPGNIQSVAVNFKGDTYASLGVWNGNGGGQFNIGSEVSQIFDWGASEIRGLAKDTADAAAGITDSVSQAFQAPFKTADDISSNVAGTVQTGLIVALGIAGIFVYWLTTPHGRRTTRAAGRVAGRAGKAAGKAAIVAAAA